MAGINFNDLPSDIMTMIMNINKVQETNEANQNKHKHKLIINELINNIDQIEKANRLFAFDWREAFNVSSEVLRLTRDNTNIIRMKKNGEWIWTDSDEEDDDTPLNDID